MEPPVAPLDSQHPLWRRIDSATENEARALLRTCCGATRWIERMLARRPFGGRDAIQAAARAEWWALGPDDWREAFGHHPRIGDREALRARFGDAGDIPGREQAGVAGAAAGVLDALAEGNRAYEARFGYIFIVCATGKRAEEMLGMLQTRLRHGPDKEIRIAAEEQARITALRLDAS